MPQQQNVGMKLIRRTSACFGTVRLDDGADASGYQNSLWLKNGQLPSVYYANDKDNGNTSSRLRPLHEHGFCVVPAETQLYFIVAGLGIVNPQIALTTNLILVEGNIHESQNFVFAKLGVGRDGILMSIANLVSAAKWLTTEELRAANAAGSLKGNSRVVFIGEGALRGTFWAFKKNGWGQQPSALDGRYLPMGLLDFSISASRANACEEGGSLNDALKEVPTERKAIHRGHTLMTVNQIEMFYSNCPKPGGPSCNVTGKMVWDNFDLLGQYQQKTGIYSNGTHIADVEILPGCQIYPVRMFEGFPDATFGQVGMETRQRQIIVDMIGAFVAA